MKKSRKIFGAVALSAVLAFGTAVPAFADNNNNITTTTPTANASDLAVVNQNSNKGDASTTINIATYSSHYSVTLPLVLPFMLDQQGGAGVAPTGYYIQNNGEEAGIEIWSVEYEMAAGNGSGANTLYTFGANTGLANGSDKIHFSLTSTPKYGSFVISAQSATTSAAKFDTTATLRGGSGTSGDDSMKALDGVTTKDGALYGYKDFAKGTWTINKADKTVTQPADANGRTVYTRDNINLSICGTDLSDADEAIKSNIAKLVYTVGPVRGA